MYWRLCLPFALFVGIAVGPRLAEACQDRVRSASISAGEVAAHEHIYVLRVTKLITGQRDSRYTPPFEFEGRIVRRLKGTLKRGAVARGRTTTWRFRSECPVRLESGKTYLVFLSGKSGKKSRLELQRFGARVVSSTNRKFPQAVADVMRHLKRRRPRK